MDGFRESNVTERKYSLFLRYTVFKVYCFCLYRCNQIYDISFFSLYQNRLEKCGGRVEMNYISVKTNPPLNFLHHESSISSSLIPLMK